MLAMGVQQRARSPAVECMLALLQRSHLPGTGDLCEGVCVPHVVGANFSKSCSVNSGKKFGKN